MKKLLFMVLFVSLVLGSKTNLQVDAKACRIGPNNCIVEEDPGTIQHLTAQQFFSTRTFKTESKSTANVQPMFNIRYDDPRLPYLKSISTKVGNYYFFVDTVYYVDAGVDFGDYYISEGYVYHKLGETSQYVANYYQDFYYGESFYDLDEIRNVHVQYRVYQKLVRYAIFQVVDIYGGTWYVPGENSTADAWMNWLNNILDIVEARIDENAGTNENLIRAHVLNIGKPSGAGVSYIESQMWTNP